MPLIAMKQKQEPVQIAKAGLVLFKQSHSIQDQWARETNYC